MRHEAAQFRHVIGTNFWPGVARRLSGIQRLPMLRPPPSSNVSVKSAAQLSDLDRQKSNSSTG
jgi:hypothetical protein